MEFIEIRKSLIEFGVLDDKLTNQLILDAIKDLCEETWLYTEIITFLSVAGTYEYTLTPSNSNTKIIGLSHDGLKMGTVNVPVLTADDSSDAGTLTVGNTYVYRVTVYVDTYGETIPQDVVSQVAPATGAIDLTWAAIGGATGYRIYRNDGAGGTTYTRMTSQTNINYTDDGTDTPDGSTEPPTTSSLVEEMDLININEQKSYYETWRQSESDDIRNLIYDGLDQVQTSRVPVTSNIPFQVELVLKPTKRITVPPIFEKQEETIRKYVRSRLFLRPATKDFIWSDSRKATFWLREYEKDRLELKAKKMYGHTGRLKVKGRNFTGPSRRRGWWSTR